MAPLAFVESSAAAPAALAERGRGLRCPSCGARVDTAPLAPDVWQVLHRCGDHVIEATARTPGTLAAWRWRTLEG